MNNKLNTEEIKFMIPDYISGSLNDTDKALVEDAIKQSDEVREFYSEMKSTLDFVGNVKFTEPSPEYWNSLLPRIHDKIESRESAGFSWHKVAAMWKVLVPIAAIILIALVYYIVKPSNTQLTEEKKTEEIKKEIPKDNIDNSNKDNTKQEKLTEDKKKEEPVKEPNQNNNAKNNAVNRYSLDPDNATAKNIIPEEEIKEIPETVKDEELAGDIEETSIFASGESAGLDEETENALKKLDDNEQESLLMELENTNL